MTYEKAHEKAQKISIIEKRAAVVIKNGNDFTAKAESEVKEKEKKNICATISIKKTDK